MTAPDDRAGRRVVGGFRYLTGVSVLVWAVATAAVVWGYLSGDDPVWLVMGSGAAVCLLGAVTIFAATRGAYRGAASSDRAVTRRAARLAGLAGAVQLAGAVVPVLVGLLVSTGPDGDASHVLLGVMAGLVVFMFGLVVGTCRRAVNRVAAY